MTFEVMFWPALAVAYLVWMGFYYVREYKRMFKENDDGDV